MQCLSQDLLHAGVGGKGVKVERSKVKGQKCTVQEVVPHGAGPPEWVAPAAHWSPVQYSAPIRRESLGGRVHQ